MASNVAISKATVMSVKRVETKKGHLLNVLIRWWEKDRSEFLGNFGNVTIFSPNGLELSSGDKVNLRNLKLKLKESDTWVQVRKADRFDPAVEAAPARFPDFEMFGQAKDGSPNADILERGDPTGKPAKKVSGTGGKLPF